MKSPACPENRYSRWSHHVVSVTARTLRLAQRDNQKISVLDLVPGSVSETRCLSRTGALTLRNDFPFLTPTYDNAGSLSSRPIGKERKNTDLSAQPIGKEAFQQNVSKEEQRRDEESEKQGYYITVLKIATTHIVVIPEALIGNLVLEPDPR